MKAMVLKEFGGVENFALQETADPKISATEVLVEVKAIGIDQIDIKTRQGGGMSAIVGKEDPMIIGWDLAGIVKEAGKEVTKFKKGDKVFGTVNFPGPGSTYAELSAVPEDQLAIIPDNVSFEEAAAATQSPLTAWQALTEKGKVQKGQKVLIHGGAGGVGNYGVQMAHYLGAYVISTASGKDEDFVKGLGADEVIDYKTQKFEDVVSDVDMVLDTIGGDNFVRSLKVLKPDGVIVLLPTDKEGAAEKAVKEHNVKNYYHLTMRSSGQDMEQIAKMLEEGSLKVHVDKTFPFEKLPEAQSQLENGGVKGKVVVTVK